MNHSVAFASGPHSGRLAHWGAGLRDFLLPAACVLCRRPLGRTVSPAVASSSGAREIVCGLCLSRIVPLALPLCQRCGHPRISALAASLASGLRPGDVELQPCKWCERLAPHVRALRSVCRMDSGTGAELVHALKYKGWWTAARPMARLMARLDWPEDVLEERTALVPVPLSRARQRERGYNQAEAIASALSLYWKIPVWNDVLQRNRHTGSQVRLTPTERAGNVSGAFTLAPNKSARLSGSHVILVDDVITTAATFNAAAEALVADGYGARIFSGVTFGRAPDPGDRSGTD